MQGWHRLVLVASVVAVSGCGASIVLPPTLKPAATAPPGSIYWDNFTNPKSGWSVTSTAAYSSSYVTGPTGSSYEIKVSGQTAVLAPAPTTGSLPQSVRVVVSVAETGTGTDSHLGVDCDYGGTDYVLLVGGEGYFGIIKLSDGTLVADLADSLALGPSQAVKNPPTVNELSASCVSSDGSISLSLGVNGTTVASATDSDAAAATAKLQIKLRDEPGSQASRAVFSGFTIYKAG
jgi:hypothetical protein